MTTLEVTPCQRLKALFDGLLSDPENAEIRKLEEEAREALLAHLQGCEPCEEMMDAVRFPMSPETGLPGENTNLIVMGFLDFIKGPANQEAMAEIEEALAAVRRANDEMVEIVRAYLKAHPNLEPSRFGLVGDEEDVIVSLFAVSESLRLLLTRYSSAEGAILNGFDFELQDGLDISIDGEIITPSQMVVAEAQDVLSDMVRKSEFVLVPFVVSAFKWLFQALRETPTLLHGLRTRFEDGKLLLRIVPRHEGEDVLDGWRIATAR